MVDPLLVHLSTLLINDIDALRGVTKIVQFFDFKISFDKVPQCHLLDKLSAFNINLSRLCWIESYMYFMHHSQTVVIGRESSVPTNVLSGIPRGSVLG